MAFSIILNEEVEILVGENDDSLSQVADKLS
jgi:hypothetical protein